MTIRFSGPLRAMALRFEPSMKRPPIPANDNSAASGGDTLLHAALRHFAEHGLAAAQRARSQAEVAFFADDREGYQWWLGICRALDRTLARQLAAQADMHSASVRPASSFAQTGNRRSGTAEGWAESDTQARESDFFVRD